MRTKTLLAIVTAFIMLISCQTGTQEPPSPVGPLPTAEHMAWHKLERYAFIHYGMYTYFSHFKDWEKVNPSYFAPDSLDCEQWARAVKGGGLNGILITARHYDGFCLWPTQTSDFGIKDSKWRDGKGDIIAELAKACKKYDLKLGIYLHCDNQYNKVWGTPAHAEWLHQQVTELVSNYGPIFEFWFDGANNDRKAFFPDKIDKTTYYQFDKIREIIKEHQPQAMIFGGTHPDIRWVGNEDGWAGQTNWPSYVPEPLCKEKNYAQSQWGDEFGTQYMPSEADTPIRGEWAYSTDSTNTVKHLPQLVEIYYNTVGHNANLILNVTVAPWGKVMREDSIRLAEWNEVIQNDFKENLLTKAKVSANVTRGSKFAAKKVRDGKYDTYWATPDNVVNGELQFSFDKPTALNRFVLQEYIPLGQRVRQFAIDYKDGNEWKSVDTTDTLSTIGFRRFVRFQTVESTDFRLRVIDARGPLCISNVEAYCAPIFLSEPKIVRGLDNKVCIRPTDNRMQIYYTTDGSEPTTQSNLYDQPFEFAQRGTIKAIACDPTNGKCSEVATELLDIPCAKYELVCPTAPEAKYLIDGDNATTYIMPCEDTDIIIRLPEKHKICGIRYTPTSEVKETCYSMYEHKVYVDGKEMAHNKFEQVWHFTYPRETRFAPIEGREVKIEAIRWAKNGYHLSFGELTLITED